MRRKQGPDADGWQTVGPAKPAGKWGESALKKAAPPPPTFEQEFPAFGNADKEKKDEKPPVTLSMADRMKKRLAEEEEVARQKAEDALRKATAAADEYERNRYKGSEFVPIASKIMSSSAVKNFDTFIEPEEDASYYNEYPHHFEEDRVPHYDYEYTYEEDSKYDEEY